jgi:protoheme IX farnesyltransferase
MKPASDVSEPLLTLSGSAPASGEAASHSRLADFYELTKPRLNFLVVITTMVGFYMAAGAAMSAWQWLLLLHTLLGTALTAASAGTLNQYIERDYDALMPRTADRPLPARRLSPVEALLFAVVMGVAGVAYLALLVNPLTAALGAFTLLSYAFIYTPLKRHSTLNTIVGAVPGAIPAVMGWTACLNVISPEAVALFLIMFIWQIPHFLAIATLYRDDYRAGGFKMLPCIETDLRSTGRQIVLYCLALIPVSLVPAMTGLAGEIYLAAAVVMGLLFLAYGIRAARTKTRLNARRLFFASIIYLPLLFAFMMIDRL